MRWTDAPNTLQINPAYIWGWVTPQPRTLQKHFMQGLLFGLFQGAFKEVFRYCFIEAVMVAEFENSGIAGHVHSGRGWGVKRLWAMDTQAVSVKQPHINGHHQC